MHTSDHTSYSPPVVLTIAGSDSGGGAGIQADIKAISATGSYACSVITALTAQNTLGVTDVHMVPIAHVAAQLDAVFTDLNIAAVKTGMLANADIISVVAQKIRQYQPPIVVVDPVMVATSGDLLLEPSAVQCLRQELLPLADLLTPNLPEACVLTNIDIDTGTTSLNKLRYAVAQLGCVAVLLKGGHLQHLPNSDDWLLTSAGTQQFNAPRINTRNSHGTGCTLSAAIASYLAQGLELSAAVAQAKHYVTQALKQADQLKVGQGRGPVDHFFMLRQSDHHEA